MKIKRKQLRLDPQVQTWVQTSSKKMSIPETEVVRLALVAAGAPDTGMLRPGRRTGVTGKKKQQSM